MEDFKCWEEKFLPCEYSNKLLKKLTELNRQHTPKVDLQEVKKATYYARKYHGEQKRQTGEPFYAHPLEVASMVSDYIFKTDAIVTSILHDTLEDTTLTFENIKDLFGIKVANQVEDLTRIKRDRKITSEELVHSLWHQKKYDVLLIKQFDRLHNMRTVHVKSSEKIKKITQETLYTFVTLSAYLNTREVEEGLVKLCMDALKIKKPSSFDSMHYNSDQALLSLLNQNGEVHM